jgi:hypothetical protein
MSFGLRAVSGIDRWSGNFAYAATPRKERRLLFGNASETTSRTIDCATHAVEAAIAHYPRHIMAFPQNQRIVACLSFELQ